jgi:F-type H+-transporting ATPase subunit b
MMEFLLQPEFWVAVSFFLFVGVVLYLGLHKKIAAALDARAAAIAKETQAIISLAGREAEILTAETRRSMKDCFERRMKLAEDKIARAETEALREVREAATDAAIAAARTVIAEKLTPDAADKLVSQGIDALKGQLN